MSKNIVIRIISREEANELRDLFETAKPKKNIEYQAPIFSKPGSWKK